MDKYQNKYRIPSSRLQNWDYRWAAAYFITICTYERIHYFGKIVSDKNIKNQHMQLSNMGIIADILWHEIKNHTIDLELGAFVVMPNHIHGILILTGNNNGGNGGNGGNVETGHALSLRHALSLPPVPNPIPPPVPQPIGQKRFQNIGKNSVSSIIGSYKSAVSKHAHRLGYNFQWQSRFYDHIIRDDYSFRKISNYIINNPKKWGNDKFYNE